MPELKTTNTLFPLHSLPFSLVQPPRHAIQPHWETRLINRGMRAACRLGNSSNLLYFPEEVDNQTGRWGREGVREGARGRSKKSEIDSMWKITEICIQKYLYMKPSLCVIVRVVCVWLCVFFLSCPISQLFNFLPSKFLPIFFYIAH